MTENQPNLTSTTRITVFIDEDKNTRLHYAAARGNIESVRKEIQDGHEIDPVNYLGWTPLMMATRHGHLEVIQFLLQTRADSTRQNNFGYNIFLMATVSGNLDVLHLILDHLLRGGVSRQSLQNFFSPVALAALLGNVRILQYLIGKQFCVNTSSSVGITPLSFARAVGNAEIINLLIAGGAKMTPNASPHEQWINDASQVKQIKKPPVLNLPPLVFVNQTPVSPQPTFLCFTPTVEMPRRCSDMTSPCFSSNITPLPGGIVQQVFFPTNFTPSHFVSPVSVFADGNELLNMRARHFSPYCSPVPINVPYSVVQ